MDSNENRVDLPEKAQQIQLVLNNPEDEEDTIDLGKVFQNFKQKKRVYAWVLLLCLVAGLSGSLLLYQLTKTPLTVSSVVTLRYETPKGSVTDLTAPDGSELDLNQITSSYVLQTALDGMSLSKLITIEALRSNIGIQTILTEESRRTMEAIAGLAEAKNAGAYEQLQEAELVYQNKFVVTLQNGFGEEDSRIKTELTDQELRLLLDRILEAYNAYLVRMYADVKLPEDAISVIDVQELDVLDSLDQLRTAISDLYDYCDEKTDAVKAYRSWRTGRSLTDLMETLETFRSINVDYLYAMVSENAITRDKAALLTSWKYLLRVAQNELDNINESIEKTNEIISSYKNNEVYISMQESDAVRSTKMTTAYYNSLILAQVNNYEKVAKLKTSIADYADRITRLEDTAQNEVTEEVETELARSFTSAQALYEEIRAHMEEVFETPMYTTFEDHSAAQGKTQSFLTAASKKMIIGGAVGLVIGFGIWFLAALMPEFLGDPSKKKSGREAV